MWEMWDKASEMYGIRTVEKNLARLTNQSAASDYVMRFI